MFKRAALAVALFLVPVPGIAERIVLRSESGFEISGDYLGYDGRYVRIASESGPLTLDLERMTCEGTACPDPATFVPELRISGAPRMAEVLLPALIESFARQDGQDVQRTGAAGTIYVLQSGERESLRLSINSSTTAEGFADLLSNEADMVMALREVSRSERRLLRDAGLGDLNAASQSRIVAVAGLVPVVAQAHSLREIPIADLARAFAGKIDNWADLNAPDGPVSLHVRGPDTGFIEGFERRFLLPSRLRLSDSITYHATEAEVQAAVEADLNALGLTTADQVVGTRVLRLTGSCGLSVGTSEETLKTADYPLAMPLFFYLPQRRLPATAARFVEWLDSPQAQAVVRRSGFTDLAASEIPLDSQGERLANAIRKAGDEITLSELQRMLRRLDGFTRLSATFRFESGSTRLDAQSRSNLRRLTQALHQGELAGRRILLAGFSDSREPGDEDRALSLARAEMLKDRLAAALRDGEAVTLETGAFGTALPMACDDTEVGRQVNRRVEVWVTSPPRPVSE